MAAKGFQLRVWYSKYCRAISTRAGTNTPSDEYDTYREYRVANTIRIANTLFLKG